MIYYPDGTLFVPDHFDFGWVDVFCDMIAYASPEIQAAIKKRVEKRVEMYNNPLIPPPGYCDVSHAADMGEKHRGWGKGYLYIWLDGEGIPFYVGKAEAPSRMGQYAYNTRSEEFQNKIREGGCHAVKVAKHLPVSRLAELEKNLIAYMCWRGFPLVNVKDMPSQEKNILWSVFQTCKNEAEVQNRLGIDATEVYMEWQTNMDDLAPIISVLNEVIGAKWEGECADLTPKEKKPPQTLTYNGVTKTWGQWGKDVGLSGKTIKIRIEKLGWPVEKALFTPSAQDVARRERQGVVQA